MKKLIAFSLLVPCIFLSGCATTPEEQKQEIKIPELEKTTEQTQEQTDTSKTEQVEQLAKLIQTTQKLEESGKAYEEAEKAGDSTAMAEEMVNFQDTIEKFAGSLAEQEYAQKKSFGVPQFFPNELVYPNAKIVAIDNNSETPFADYTLTLESLDDPDGITSWYRSNPMSHDDWTITSESMLSESYSMKLEKIGGSAEVYLSNPTPPIVRIEVSARITIAE
ncbi:MAG: hypothetical protein V1848_00070 [Candidatus Magasanikbacteria bacterium]